MLDAVAPCRSSLRPPRPAPSRPTLAVSSSTSGVQRRLGAPQRLRTALRRHCDKPIANYLSRRSIRSVERCAADHHQQLHQLRHQLAFTVAASGPFTLSQNTCTGSLAAGANCTASIVFQHRMSAAHSRVRSPSVLPWSPRPLSSLSPARASISQSAVSGPTEPHRRQRPASQLHARRHTQRRNRLVHLFLRNAAHQRALPLQPHHRIARFRRAGQRACSDLHRNGQLRRVSIDPRRGARCHLSAGCSHCLSLFAGVRKFLLLALFAVILAAGITSCTSSGGGSGNKGGQGNSNNTPAGTYTIPVTLTSMGINHSVNLTLTVD